jgi:hypothetical protein
MAIDFDSIFADYSSDAPQPSAEEVRANRLAREDADLFAGKRMHSVSLQLSMERRTGSDFDATTLTATQSRPDGQHERIGVVFQGQRKNDLKSSKLMKEFEADRQALLAKDDYSDPSKAVEVTGAWRPRTWRDAKGNPHKAFDLVAASWSFTSKSGERITEGHTPELGSKEDQRMAAIRDAAQKKADGLTSRKTSPRDEAR